MKLKEAILILITINPDYSCVNTPKYKNIRNILFIFNLNLTKNLKKYIHYLKYCSYYVFSGFIFMKTGCNTIDWNLLYA